MNATRFIVMFLLMCTLYLYGAPGKSDKIDLEAHFNQLDRALRNRKFYILKKKQDLFSLEESLNECTLDNDRGVIYKRLYDEYLKFNTDSAIAYADKYEKISQKQGARSLVLQAELDKAMALILHGWFPAADDELQKCGAIEDLPPQLQQKFAITEIEYTWRNRQPAEIDWMNAGQNDSMLKTCWNKYEKYIPGYFWIHDYYEALMTDHDVSGRLLYQLKFAPTSSIQASMIEFALAKTYKTKNKPELCDYYLIQSAINDICKANCDAPALMYLLESPGVRLNLKRAYAYAMACTENLELFDAMPRSPYIIRAQTAASENYNARLQNRVHILSGIIILLLVEFIVIFIQFYRSFHQNRRKMALLNKLLESKERQADLMEQKLEARLKIENINGRLEEALKRRNTYFINDYLLISRYISEEMKFRKNIFNLLVAGKASIAIKKLEKNSNIDESLSDFYRQFDIAFLNFHPDFIKRFNQFLDADKQIFVSEPDTLSIELRIYALISLGVTDSISIAGFLHYSPQTIYNYRSKIRHSSSIHQKDFDEMIERMYYC